MSLASLASSTSGQSSSDGSVSGNIAASQVHRVRCPYSIFNSDEFEETLKSDEIHCMRDNNNGCR